MQNATKYGNMTEDHVMHLLQNADPLKVYPPLKGNFPENLRHLKSTMETLDWKVFESWMHHWLLFEMSKHSLEQKPTEAPPKVLTKCQEEVSHIPAVHPGSFRPKCDENGNYLPLQCYGSTGYCWCVFPNGTEVPNTRSRGHQNCSGKQSHCASVRGPGRTRKVEGQEVPSEAHGTRTPGMAVPGGSDVVMHPAPYPSTHLCVPICPFVISPLTSTHLFVHLSVSPFICEFHPSTHHPLARRSPTGPPISFHHPLLTQAPIIPLRCCLQLSFPGHLLSQALSLRLGGKHCPQVSWVR
ncbi:PREDICTED: HLA class II histocompatibility antigen gamma chain isoform X4 [Mandrillus leucophaeus]|nr:PREDICTED: HLA class II histocompatibility antigen gamma chain isoform X4 [Mandrillus leucophaeus]